MNAITLRQDFCPDTLSPLPIDRAQLARLADMSAAEREYELGLMTYAHLHRETCRVRLVAILRHSTEMELQRHWQDCRERYIARALREYERTALIVRAEACAAGFDLLHRAASAEVTRSYAAALRAGMPSALYSYQIAAQEKRLMDKMEQAQMGVRLPLAK